MGDAARGALGIPGGSVTKKRGGGSGGVGLRMRMGAVREGGR